jgi:hypothetical protein
VSTMAQQPEHKGPFSAVSVSGKFRMMAEAEEAARASGQKPGSVMPEMFEMVRQFVCAHQEAFNEFVPRQRPKG